MSSVSNAVVRRKRIDDALARQNFAAPSPPRPPVNPATYSFVSPPPLPWIHKEEAKKIASNIASVVVAWPTPSKFWHHPPTAPSKHHFPSKVQAPPSDPHKPPRTIPPPPT